MITNDRLDIFDRFVIDENLQRKSYTIERPTLPLIRVAPSVVEPEARLGPEPKGFWAWLKPKPKYEMTILEFFSAMKNSVSELIVAQDYEFKYDAAIKKARSWGQVVLAEKMEHELSVVRVEAQLLSVKSGKFLTEETVVKLAKKSPKGIRLDWIKNFTRIIPEEIIAKKKMLDARYIFDNYAIMYCGHEGNTRIMFGVVCNSRKLYYVGDWIDEHCNLTIAQMAEILGGHNDLA